MPTIMRDLAVELGEDRPGMLARAAGAIASGGLELEGFAEVEGILHVLTSEPRSARLALGAAGLRVVAEREVVVAPLGEAAGSAAGVFSRLAAAGVNVAYTYVASGNRVVVAADEPQRAVAALRD